MANGISEPKAAASDAADDAPLAGAAGPAQKLPKGMVLGPDGKP